MFPKITAVLNIQVGLMAHTRQSLQVWSLVESVILTSIITGSGTGTRQASAVSIVTISESETVALSLCMSYKSLLIAILVTVVTAAQVSCLVCFFECVRQEPVIKQSSSPISKQSLKTSSSEVFQNHPISKLRWLLTVPDDNKAVSNQTDHNSYWYYETFAMQFLSAVFAGIGIIPFTRFYYHYETRYFAFLFSQ